ncbi:MAG: AMP-binding protein [Candidatus Rokubacteria bacterium]|nr:AMP-binding protein [Candidatus Rokubacteria bacterium]
MPGILDLRSYPEALRAFRWGDLWELFDGDRGHLNIAHECVDRHAGAATALRLKFADGHREEYTFADLSRWSGHFASFLETEGVARGDRVGIMLEPSLAFYGALFGTLKRGAVAVPLFTLFGPEGLALRVDDCRPRMLLVADQGDRWRARFPDLRVVSLDEGLAARLERERGHGPPSTAADDLAVLQYTSGTTRALPEAVPHTHRAVITLMVAALYGVGLRRGDRYFCPSSPAWGHGLWHGTIAPLALGIAVGAYSGKFDPARILEALEEFRVTNVAAAPTVYRMLERSGLAQGRRFSIEKLSFTGEPMDPKTREFVEATFGVAPRSMYGSTEVGVVIVDYPGFAGYEVRPGALGRAAPGWEVAIVDDGGRPLPPGTTGEIAVRRRDGWFLLKDRGHMDEDGFFHHAGRSDDVIISAGWTMSAVEIEDALRAHPDVVDAAVVGVADELRGEAPKAYVVARRRDTPFVGELQEFVKERLSRHEYPRRIELIDELPRTPAGKVDRKALRDREAGVAP